MSSIAIQHASSRNKPELPTRWLAVLASRRDPRITRSEGHMVRSGMSALLTFARRMLAPHDGQAQQHGSRRQRPAGLLLAPEPPTKWIASLTEGCDSDA